MATGTSDSHRLTAMQDGRATADFAFTDLADGKGIAGIDPDLFRAGQIAAIIRNVPAMMMANIVAVALSLWLAAASLAVTGLTMWAGAMVVASGAAWLVAAKFQPALATRRTIGMVAGWAVLFAVLWALVPVVCLRANDPDLCSFILAIVMAVGGLGACALARVPHAALLFIVVLTSAIALSFQALDQRIAIAVLIFAASYGAALAVIVFGTHKTAVWHAANAAELERQREIIQLLLKDFEAGASDWLWETGPSGELVYVSDGLAQVLRRDRDLIIGAKLHQAAGMAQAATGWRTLALTMARRQPVCELALPVRRKRAQSWWQISARPLHDAAGVFRGYRGVGRDITATREAAIKVLRAKEAAERASAAKSRFLATMSHELRTPLNAIVGFSEIIAEQRDGPIDSGKYADYARSIVEGSKHLAALISDILDVARFESGAGTLIEQEVDLVEVAEVVVKMCRGAARAKAIALTQDFSIEPLEVRGEMARLHQVMAHLVNNALKFTPAGGTVRMALARDQRGGVEFVVSDNGIGISKTDLKRVFEPFVQAEDASTRRFGGIGLGLAISRSVARLHGGDIVLTSRPGYGTVAKLVLPASRTSLPRPRRAVTAAA